MRSDLLAGTRAHADAAEPAGAAGAAAPATPLLEARDVTVDFIPRSGAPVRALDRVSLSVSDGEFVVALGASGCGKTTLLRLLAGFHPPTSGIALYRDRPITEPSAARGVVFQNHALFPWLSVYRNVEFGLRLRRVERPQRQLRVARLLEQVGLGDAGDKPIWALSGGMQQRVGLARALASDPEILLMDEPLGALDAITRQAMQVLLLNVWAETGKSVFLISHDIEEALFLATRLVVMSPSPGRIVHERNVDFGRRAVAGENPRGIKSDPAFVAAREEVLELILGDAGAVPDPLDGRRPWLI